MAHDPLEAPTPPSKSRETRRIPEIRDHHLLCCIGEGAYGAVWLAKSVIGTFRAVKVVYRDHFSDDRPYEREFTGIKSFEPISRSNEGLVDILQIGRDDQAGYFYYVMELADESNAECRVQNAEFPTPIFTPHSYIPKTLSTEIKRRGRLPYEECLQLGLS